MYTPRRLTFNLKWWFGRCFFPFPGVKTLRFHVNLSLVGGFNPSEKYESKWESSPIFGVNIKKYLKPPTQFWVFPKTNGTPKSSILTGFSIINQPFWGAPIFGNTYIYYTQHLSLWAHIKSSPAAPFAPAQAPEKAPWPSRWNSWSSTLQMFRNKKQIRGVSIP